MIIQTKWVFTTSSRCCVVDCNVLCSFNRTEAGRLVCSSGWDSASPPRESRRRRWRHWRRWTGWTWTRPTHTHTHTRAHTSNGSVRSNVSINSGVWMAADSGDAFRFYVFYIKHWPWAVAAMCNLFYVAARDTVRVDFGVPGRRGTASVAKAVVGSDVLVPGEHGARFVRGARILAVFDAAEVAKLYCVGANCIHRMYACSRQQGACTGTKGRLSTSKYTLVQYCVKDKRGEGFTSRNCIHAVNNQPFLLSSSSACIGNYRRHKYKCS